MSRLINDVVFLSNQCYKITAWDKFSVLKCFWASSHTLASFLWFTPSCCSVFFFLNGFRSHHHCAAASCKSVTHFPSGCVFPKASKSKNCRT